MRRALAVLVLVFVHAPLAGCDSGTGDTATETNVMRVPCTRDEDCGGSLRCLPNDAATADGGHTGLCEVIAR